MSTNATKCPQRLVRFLALHPEAKFTVPEMATLLRWHPNVMRLAVTRFVATGVLRCIDTKRPKVYAVADLGRAHLRFTHWRDRKYSAIDVEKEMVQKVISACAGFNTTTGCWHRSAGMTKDGPEYIQRALVGVLIGKCEMPEAVAEKAVVLTRNKDTALISLPRIHSQFWPDVITPGSVANEFNRIIEEFNKEMK